MSDCLSGLVNRIIAWADRLQREHSVLGFPYAVAVFVVSTVDDHLGFLGEWGGWASNPRLADYESGFEFPCRSMTVYLCRSRAFIDGCRFPRTLMDCN